MKLAKTGLAVFSWTKSVLAGRHKPMDKHTAAALVASLGPGPA